MDHHGPYTPEYNMIVNMEEDDDTPVSPRTRDGRIPSTAVSSLPPDWSSNLAPIIPPNNNNNNEEEEEAIVASGRLPVRTSCCSYSTMLAHVCCCTIPIFLWIGIRLLLYVIVLFPVFLRMIYYYFFISHRQFIRYGNDSCRQTMDKIDPPEPRRPRPIRPTTSVMTDVEDPDDDENDESNTTTTNTTTTPIVFFVCGGAWIIGYKMWGALLARVLTQIGHGGGTTVVLVDYRNYPWGNVPDALEDVKLALTYINTWNRPIVAIGQSAGSHLLITMLLQQALLNNQERIPRDTDDDDEAEKNHTTGNDDDDDDGGSLLRNVRGVIALSGPLDLEAMEKTFRKCGMAEGFVDRIFGGQRDNYDPMQLLNRLDNHNNHAVVDNTIRTQYLPPLRIYHGTADVTVPIQVARNFIDRYPTTRMILEQVKFYENWSHTDPILEGIADGDHRFHRDVFDAIQQWTNPTGVAPNLEWPNDNYNDNPILKRLAPHCLVQLARFFMPF